MKSDSGKNMIFDGISRISLEIVRCGQVLKSRSRSAVLKKIGGSQNSRVSQLPARISPSSDGVEIKTGYVGLPTQRVLSRMLVFRVNSKIKLNFRCRD